MIIRLEDKFVRIILPPSHITIYNFCKKSFIVASDNYLIYVTGTNEVQLISEKVNPHS